MKRTGEGVSMWEKVMGRVLGVLGVGCWEFWLLAIPLGLSGNVEQTVHVLLASSTGHCNTSHLSHGDPGSVSWECPAGGKAC